MGEIRILDGETEVESNLPTMEGTVVVNVDGDGEPSLAVSPDARSDDDPDADGGHHRTSVGDGSVLDGAYWLLLAPAAAALGSTALLRTPLVASLSPGWHRLLTGTLFVGTALVAGLAALWMYDDAAALEAADAPWQPNPWAYFLAGGVCLSFVGLVWVGDPVRLVTEVQALSGLVVNGLVFSSVVAGPVYLFNRRRRVGLE